MEHTESSEGEIGGDPDGSAYIRCNACDHVVENVPKSNYKPAVKLTDDE
jgi:hypothetical protein